ncbi:MULTISPECIES: cyclic pyranopterin monophosphate synthase MoaC [Micrococcaceae]|uniref:cyclic pyranopterin monophosphate synthase MoaC n=1 Tax=Micrococcaceae TaxID=1268 RepID=UPI00160C9AB1|nr:MULTISPECIES: cyclic pyranopterin monophosphate synthase MoaC [Micrococcaceae]MBB5748640.1 cyclic pyranopterin phosphate synthase [Micrococcus sp. TA1]HRO30150.1 cyclic pyranopterin monophosphate synthase MoaC [Citricoccus sp.]HRO95074.1 cyclic pyranopterin monophosphate synthase MoaC [Citricoccus sp.]
MTPADRSATETAAATGSPGASGADGFTHLDGDGSARMVDVTAKSPTVRAATAEATVLVSPEVLAALTGGTVPKGDVWAVARIAGIQAAKRCAELLPLAHVIGVHGATVDFEVGQDRIRILATTRTADRTGVEMEALTAASVAGLAMVDMVKGLDRSVELTGIRLLEKTGGRSGTWRRGDRA